MSWIVQLRPPSAGERYLTKRGKGVTTDRLKAKVFSNWAEADSFCLQASRLWPASQVIQLTLPISTLVSMLTETFARFQAVAGPVGSVWLHPACIPTLQQDSGFDKVSRPDIWKAFKDCGGDFEGVLLGALVFSSDRIPEGHIGLIPEGFRAELLSPDGCMPLALR